MASSKLILDRYRVIGQAGAGGYGTVVHAFDTHLKRDVAIKCIELSEDEVARARLVALEARMAADLEAPVDEGAAVADGPATAAGVAPPASAPAAAGVPSAFPAAPDFLRGVDERRGRRTSASAVRAGAVAPEEVPPWDEVPSAAAGDGAAASLAHWDARAAAAAGAARPGLGGHVAPRKTRHAPGEPAPAVEVQDAAPMSDYFDESAVDVRHLRGIRASRTIDGASEKRRRRGGKAACEAAADPVATVSQAPAPSADLDEPDDADLFEHIPGLEEARSVAKLSDANIVTVYDCAVEDSCAYVIMEYIEGKTLAEIIDEIDDNITLDVVAAVFTAVAHALEVAHSENTLHLDIKPENVIVNAKGVAKVTDFGLAALMDATGSGTTGGGTIGYMPLEQMRQEPLDVRTDEWALASLTYEMLAGENPFFAATLRGAEEAIEDAELVLPSLCWDELPAEADDVMFMALDPDREERYATIAEFSEALMPLLGNVKKGKKVLADIVKGKEDAVAPPEPAVPAEPLPPLVDRLGLRGLTVLGHAVAAVAVGLMAAVACANIHLTGGSALGLLTDSPVVFWVVVAVAAGVAAIRPSIGALLGYGALVVALGAHGDWVLALFTAAATGGWWYLIGRRGTTQAVSALVQPLLGAFGFAGVSPVLSGVLLPVLQAAISAAFAFLMALVMGSFGSLDLLNWDAVLHMELSGNPQAACMAMLSQSGTWVIGISWVVGAVVYSLFCVRGTKAFDVAGSIACAVVLMLGVCAASHLSAFGGSWLPTPAALLGALVPGVLGIVAAVMNAPDRARWAEEEWYLDEEEVLGD